MKTTCVALAVLLGAVAAVGCAPEEEANPKYCGPGSDAACARDAAAAREAGPEVGAQVDAVDVARLDVPADAPADVGAADVPADSAVDVREAGPEAIVDGVGSCSVDEDCPAGAPLCLGYACRKCGSDGECAGRPGTPACEKTSGRCVACVENKHCGAGKPVCDASASRCVECLASADCKTAGKPLCNAAKGCVSCADATAPSSGCATKSPALPACHPASGSCVECAESADCKSAGKPICLADRCVACGATGVVPTACASKSAALPVCHPASGSCVECASIADCKTALKPICLANGCVACSASGVAATACASRSAALPACDAISGACVECTASSQCTRTAAKPICGSGRNCVSCGDAAAPAGACAARNPSLPACNPTAGTCVACASSRDCLPDKPVCDVATNRCVRCLQNPDCSGATPVCKAETCVCTEDSHCIAGLGPYPGVCMSHQDGRCATAAESFYVSDVRVCSGQETGSYESPFCSIQSAIDGLSDTRRVIVVNTSGVGFTWTTGGKQVTVVGKAGAQVTDGVLVSKGDLFMRDVTVSAYFSTAIVAQDGATLRLLRTRVYDTSFGGILLLGAGFDITDSWVYDNGVGIHEGTQWGGILVKNPPAAGPAKLERVSLTGNGDAGIRCNVSVAGIGVLAFDNFGEVQIAPECGFSSCLPGGPGCGSSLGP